MSTILTEIDNLNYFQENSLPTSKEELLKIQKSQIELQNKLIEQIKSTEAKLNLEKNNSQKMFQMKEEEIKKKSQELQKLKNNNERLKENLQRLQVETNKRLDKIEMKEKNELYEKEKEKRQSSLEQLLHVKEKEIVNSIQIIEKKKKKMKSLETILEKNVDMSQINNLYYRINMAKTELANLNTEKESLEKIKEEHFICQQKIENLLSEIEKLKGELRTAQLENRNREQEERKYVLYSNNNSSETNNIQRKIRVTKSSELPFINPNKDIKKKKEIEKDGIDEYIKKIENVEKEQNIINKRMNLKKTKMNEEKQNLKQKNANCEEQIKEEENKNKLLMIQIEEQKIELKDLYEKVANYTKRVENKKKILNEKDEENKKFIQQVKNQKISSV